MVSKPPGNQMLSECICFREQTAIFCTNCVTFSFGRIVRQCNKHKNVKFLMDLAICPNCKASKDYVREIAMDQFNAKSLSSVNLNENLRMDSVNKKY